MSCRHVRMAQTLTTHTHTHSQPVLVICHQAVMRVLLAYFVQAPQTQCPHIDCPLHQVVQLAPGPYECQRTDYNLEMDVRSVLSGETAALQGMVVTDTTVRNPNSGDPDQVLDMYQAQQVGVGNAQVSSRLKVRFGCRVVHALRLAVLHSPRFDFFAHLCAQPASELGTGAAAFIAAVKLIASRALRIAVSVLATTAIGNHWRYRGCSEHGSHYFVLCSLDNRYQWYWPERIR
jgi:hypothetical protein